MTDGLKRPRRARSTRLTVIWTDRLMGALIRLGGIAVIAAITLIVVYLVIVVRPLFRGAEIHRQSSYSIPATANERILFAEVDEYRLVGVALLESGEMVVFDARSGRPLWRSRIVPATAAISAWSHGQQGELLALGLEDGSILSGRLRFNPRFLDPGELSAEMRGLRRGQSMDVDGGVIEMTSEGDVRGIEPVVTLEPIGGRSEASPVRLLDYRGGDSSQRLAALYDSGRLIVHEISRRENMLTGESVVDSSERSIPPPPEQQKLGLPQHLLFAGAGDQLYLAWSDGSVVRYDLRDPADARLVERADLTPEPTTTLTALSFMFGDQSLIAGDSAGNVRAWFRLQRGTRGDGYALVPAHTFASSQAGITSLGMSQRDKTFAAGRTDGGVVLYHLTSGRRLAELRPDPSAPLLVTQITPKGDGVFLAARSGRAALVSLHNPHPETTWGSIFGKVWYEGYPTPGYTWQSSSGTDDFEPKLSLIPLIVGTLKATLYSMLFAVPIALLAALYTSEFLDRRYRGIVKPVVEMMASLPSVVLGFIAALVLAPIVESSVMAVLAACCIVPVIALGFGFAWQTLPKPVALRFGGHLQLLILALVEVAALSLATPTGSLLEHTLFGGDFKGWLDGRTGNGTPGLILILWPLVLAALLIADARWVAPRLRRAGGSRGTTLADFTRYVAVVAASILLAVALGTGGGAAGADLRGELFGTYVQRNALIVGFTMGFAVIPVIYTIAEDALSSVPGALRSASLGCGASRWQTATRVVLPVAASGIFSAIMVGLGRAVGETMIVLMAAGNTPVLDMNIFSGLRTLSANIAVELPEAVRDGSLYRVLFLAALTLFVVTFVVNTAAELVRRRFRKRAFQL